MAKDRTFDQPPADGPKRTDKPADADVPQPTGLDMSQEPTGNPFGPRPLSAPEPGPEVVDARKAADDARAKAGEAEAEAARKAHEAGIVPETGPLVNPGPPPAPGDAKKGDRPKEFRVTTDALGFWRKGHAFDLKELPEGSDVESLIALGAVTRNDPPK